MIGHEYCTFYGFGEAIPKGVPKLSEGTRVAVGEPLEYDKPLISL